MPEAPLPPSVPVPASVEYSSGMKFSDSTIKFQLNINDLLADIRRDLRNEQLSDEGRWFVPEGIHPIVNDQGIAEIISVIRTFVNRNNIMTKLDEKHVLALCMDLELDLLDKSVLCYKEWKLDKTDLPLLIRKIMVVVYCGLMRAESEGERRYLGEKMMIREVIGAQQMQPKTGLFTSIFRR